MASLNITQPIILASSSPRRKALLQQLGIDFACISPDIDESVYHYETVEEYVERLAYTKAHTILRDYPQHLVIAGDTTVSIDGEILGQAETFEQAVEIWSQLSGRWHEVLTGICICNHIECMQQVVRTRVQFHTLTMQDMEDYWASGEPLGKAGAYAIQGIAGKFVPQILGSYSNVVGLPLHETMILLQQFSE